MLKGSEPPRMAASGLLLISLEPIRIISDTRTWFRVNDTLHFLQALMACFAEGFP